MKQRAHNALNTILLGWLTIVVVYGYYGSPLRDRIEQFLFDLRAIVAPKTVLSKEIAIVGVSRDVTSYMEGSEAKRLGAHSLTVLVQRALELGAKTVCVLIAPPYDDPGLSALANLAQFEPRLIIGSFELNANSSLQESIPAILRPVSSSVFAADLETYSYKQIVRSLPAAELNSETKNGYLLPALAQRARDDYSDKNIQSALFTHLVGDEASMHFRMNYVLDPRNITTIDAMDLINQSQPDLQNKTVFIGSTFYIPRGPEVGVSSFINTPWQNDGGDLSLGIPSVFIHAIGLQNLLDGSWLRPVHPFVQWLHVFFLSLFAALLWRWRIGFATAGFLGLWILIILLHGAMGSYFNLYMPLSESFAFSIVASIGASLVRIRQEGRKRAEALALVRSNLEIASIQERFLHGFSKNLRETTEKIINNLTPYSDYFSDNRKKIFNKALESGYELRDFFAGIENFITMSRGGITQVRYSKLKLRDIVERSLKRYEAKIQDASLVVSVSIEPNIIVTGDELLLDQVVTNLISNAVKYSPTGGKIKISTRDLRKRRTELCIADEGPGISPELQERIFEKFYRVKDDLVYKVKGHGLGLFLSRYFATRMGAHISVSSELGKGSTFFLNLKRVQ